MATASALRDAAPTRHNNFLPALFIDCTRRRSKAGNRRRGVEVVAAMPLFSSFSRQCATLSQAFPPVDGAWRLPDDIPLATLLELTPTQADRLGAIEVANLRLCTRPSNVFSSQGITHVGQVLELTLADLMALPAMGYGSVAGVLESLLAFLNPAPVVPRWTARSHADSGALEPLTLGHERELFGGPPSCAMSLPWSRLGLSEGVRHRLEDAGLNCLHSLLDQTHARVCEIVGHDGAEEVVEAVTACAVENRGRDMETRDRTRVLEERWGHLPVSRLNLKLAAERAVRRAQVGTISELLAALEPLHVEMALDPLAFAQIWTALQALGLRDEDWEDAGERLSEEAYARTGLDHIVRAWREGSKASSWVPAAMRFGLTRGADAGPWRMPTLEELAGRFAVTRERIRQIELRFVKRLTNAQDDYFVALQNTLGMIVSQAGGVVSLQRAAEDLTEWINPGNTAPEGVCRLVLNHSPLFAPIRKNYVYALVSAPGEKYHAIVQAAQRLVDASLEEFEVETLAQAVVGALAAPGGGAGFSPEFAAACLVASGRFGSETRLSAAADLVRLLRTLGSPRHFTEIADRLNETGWREKPMSHKYAHNYLLSRRDLFVYVAPGTYGLGEWGLEDRRIERGGPLIGDLAAEFLEASGAPVSGEDIVAYVQSRKTCRDLSVWQCLSYDGRFHKFDRNKYGLAKWAF